MTTARPALGPVQQAVYSALVGDEVLSGIVSGVWDHVPEGAVHPYVTIGEATETPQNRHRGFGRETVATLHVWSRERGFAQGQEIADRVVQLLDHQPLDIPGRHLVACRFEFGQTLRDSDLEIRHIVLRFRIETEQPPITEMPAG